MRPSSGFFALAGLVALAAVPAPNPFPLVLLAAIASLVAVAAKDGEVPELVGAAEASAILGVASSNLNRVVGLPEPAQRLAAGPVWKADDIRALAERRAARKDGR